MREDIECLTIGAVAASHLCHTFPEAHIDFLAYQFPESLKFALPTNVSLFDLNGKTWPEEILPAMEWFFELAAQIIKEEYTSIINLDTAFMPCMLARFLSDAGEPVSGNKININVQQLISKLVDHSLQPEYVNQMSEYLTSSFVGMSRWRQYWWRAGVEVEFGYPEYYLKDCCGFDELDYQLRLEVEANPTLAKKRALQPVIALSSGIQGIDNHDSTQLMHQLEKQLSAQGFHVWHVNLSEDGYLKTAKKLKASSLAVMYSEPAFWLAKAVSCTTLFLSEGVEPVTMMPDYSTDPNQPIRIDELMDDINQLFEESTRVRH